MHWEGARRDEPAHRARRCVEYLSGIVDGPELADRPAQHASAGVTGKPGAHLPLPLFSAAALASHSRRQSAAASPVIIRLTPARINRGPRPAFHSEYRKLRLIRCALQNSATVNAIGPGRLVDSDSLLSGPVLLWR